MRDRFDEGVIYALEYLEDVFGSEIRRTDLWLDFIGDDEDE